MAVNAYDVQVCLWKMLKLSSKTCVTVSIKHPYVSSSLLCLFLLYICFPLVFWVLIYSLPLVVCTCIILSISFSLRNDRKYKEDGEGENGGNFSRKTKFAADDSGDDKSKKSYSRVHSVRRRRAKEIMMEDNVQHNVEEKNAVSSTNFNCDMVDKNALIEESPKEIREVEVDFSLVNSAKATSSSASQNSKDEFDEESDQMGSLEGLKDEEEEANKAILQGNNDDDQKNVMDVGISDAERNKRLESLIARRRSRKLLSLQVRRSLMNMDRNDHLGGQISSLIIPKLNTSFSPSKVGGPFSPGPGSAPSVLIPMRNPFDLPYDPQEEKPDLTGDSFHQEFTLGNNRDIVFCRHESFSLGPSLPGEFFQNREGTSLVNDFGFRLRGSSIGYQFSKPGNESDRECAPLMEQESYEVSESKSNIDSPDDDHIKEVIQIYENGTENNSEEGDEEVDTRPIPQDFSTSSSSRSSSEEDQPIFKIDREAILKSLSSMRRNALQEIENNERIGDNLSYANSALESASRLKEQYYYADKPKRRHTPSYSIASDMQVEVSEVCSPPLTIDENMSYQDEDVSTYDGDIERNISWDGEDLWAGSSRMSEVDDNESRSTQVNEIIEQDIIKFGFSRIKKPEDTALLNSIEEPLNEKHCIHSCSSNAEFSDSGESQGINLHDKILQDENDHQIKQYAMEQLAAESMKSSEDSEERLTPAQEEMVEVTNHDNIEQIQHIECELSSHETSINRPAIDSNDPQAPSLMPNVAVEHVQSSIISPKSVLLPTLSLSNFDPDIDEEVQQSGVYTAEVSSPVATSRNSTALMEQSTVLACSDGEAEVLQESSEPSNTSTIEVDDTGSLNEKLKIQGNDIQTNEGASGSSQILGIHEAPAQPREETSSRSFNNTDEVSCKDFEAANPNSFSTNIAHTDNSIQSLSTEEELSKYQEMSSREITHNDGTKSSSYEDEDQTQISALREEKGHERQTNSTSSNCFDGTKDEVQDFDADEAPVVLSGLVEDNDNSKSYEKNEADGNAKQYANSHEAMAETINTLHSETKQTIKWAQ